MAPNTLLSCVCIGLWFFGYMNTLHATAIPEMSRTGVVIDQLIESCPFIKWSTQRIEQGSEKAARTSRNNLLSVGCFNLNKRCYTWFAAV